jgi:hypothetical protein
VNSTRKEITGITIKHKVKGVKIVNGDAERFRERTIGILYYNDDGDDYYRHVHNCMFNVKHWICVNMMYLEYVCMYMYICMYR